MVYQAYTIGMVTPQRLQNGVDTDVYGRLKLMILDGEIGRGEPLVERSVAAQLGVSRTPVRETLFRLEREGLVRIVEGKGAFVASYTIEDVIEIYQVRIGLEPLAARLACPHLDIDDLSRAEEQLNRYKAKPSLMTSDSASWLKLGREFHGLFIRASRNNRLIQVIEGMQDHIDLVRGIGRTISTQATSESTLQEHIAILRALKARDPDRAERAVRLHLQNGLKHRLDGLQVKA